jgi:hypothetical protein
MRRVGFRKVFLLASEWRYLPYKSEAKQEICDTVSEPTEVFGYGPSVRRIA